MPKREPEDALYVRLPATVADKLDRAAEALGIRKKDLVASLVARHVDPDSKRGLAALGALAQPRRITVEVGEATPTVGSYSFQPHDPPEVLTATQVADLLQLAEKVVLELAAAGTLPGKQLGGHWRFSRAAILAWLAS